MESSGRRKFIGQSLVLATALAVPGPVFSLGYGSDPFRMSLNPGAIGVELDQQALVDAAVRYGFGAIVPFPDELDKMEAKERLSLKEEMKIRHLTWDAAGLPVEFRSDRKTFARGLEKLPGYARAMRAVGADKMNTWIMPTHDVLTYRENFRQHTERLREVAAILQEFDIRLGLEYVGPKTLMARDRYPFIHTLRELKELIEAIGRNKVGIQLDSFHWFCAGETTDDLRSLDKYEIITVDLNDARTGRTADQQLDWERELPGVSGMIDLKGFLTALHRIGYDGPVRAEPFNAALNALDNEEALQKTYQTMSKTFRLLEP